MSRLIIICGHYGTGKTNFALNLALDAAASGTDTTIADLDIVNPYFRTSDYTDSLRSHGIRVVAPVMAGTTLDAPSISAEMYSLFSGSHSLVIIDAGGDDVGATALGRFEKNIKENGYELLYVINKYRSMISEPSDAVGLLREIEAASKLRATGIINNSHLATLTTPEDILASVAYAEETAKLAELPLLMTTAPEDIAPSLSGKIANLRPVKIEVTLPWNEKGIFDHTNNSPEGGNINAEDHN